MKPRDEPSPAWDAGDDILLAAERSLSTCGDDTSAGSVTALLAENQVPFLSLAAANSTIVGSPEFRSALAAEKQRYQEAHGHFSAFVRRLRERGIECICFKSAGIPPSFAYTSENYDILFRPGDEAGARETLVELGYVELRNIEEHRKWLFRLFIGGRSVSAIHLHTRVGWGQGFMLEDEIWTRARVSPDDPITRVPGPEDAILINVAHAFYENKAFGLHDLMKVRHAVQSGADWEYCAFVARRRGWLRGLAFGLTMINALEYRLFDLPSIEPNAARRFESFCSGRRMATEISRAQSEPPKMPFLTSWALSKGMYFEKLARDRDVPARAKPEAAVLAFARGLKGQLNAHPQNSALFALSGVDGSGKTRQAKALVDVFEIAELRATTRWARLGATPVMSRVSRLWRRDKAVSVTESSHEQATTGRRGRMRAFAQTGWACAAAADFALWSMGLRWRLLRGDVVITDRYVCDLDVELAMKLPARSRLRHFLVNCLRAVSPTPRAAFLLDIGASDAHRRAQPDSDDFDPAAVIDLYRARVRRYGLQTVNAAQSFDDSSAALVRDALTAYMERYGTVGNLLYFANPWQLNRRSRAPGPERLRARDNAA